MARARRAPELAVEHRPTFFAASAEFGAWLTKHASSERELIVGFHKRASGLESMSWPESVDEALCFGWIDGVRTRIDEHSYRIRFTPRKPGSTWSAVNIAKVQALQRLGRLRDAGLAAFSHRRDARSGTYAYEQAEAAALQAEEEARFRADKAAWRFFEAQPPGYRHLVVWRIVTAKRAATRESRLAKLIEGSRNRVRL